VSTCTKVTSDRPAPDDTILQARRSFPDKLLREALAMPKVRRILTLIAVSAFLCALAAHGQDAQSLGDAARKARLQKQQKDAGANKDAQAKDATSKDPQSKETPAKDVQPKDAQPKAKKVITNDEIPEHIGPTSTRPAPQTPGVTYPQPYYGDGKLPADYWKNQIQAQKDYITSLQNQITSLTAALQNGGGNCISNCVQSNVREQQREQQLEMMKSQLVLQQKNLEQIQEMARKQGFGSSVYDP